MNVGLGWGEGGEGTRQKARVAGEAEGGPGEVEQPSVFVFGRWAAGRDARRRDRRKCDHQLGGTRAAQRTEEHPESPSLHSPWAVQRAVDMPAAEVDHPVLLITARGGGREPTASRVRHYRTGRLPALRTHGGRPRHTRETAQHWSNCDLLQLRVREKGKGLGEEKRCWKTREAMARRWAADRKEGVGGGFHANDRKLFSRCDVFTRGRKCGTGVKMGVDSSWIRACWRKVCWVGVFGVGVLGVVVRGVGPALLLDAAHGAAIFSSDNFAFSPTLCWLSLRKHACQTASRIL